ncbi:hypothetical protein OO013_05425 [Mangrovivirga sp. M17]|uniref:Lipocalin-like domain-containing protein n=1 Tax=Mangrovivirga halotolerans TaxID=2993936 RepID=A0ABT3RNB1_9BACT|nr:hypothetical protein [Mangrovivirga halotolerans]MCX2743294.1 hypothetical protein [Mangrovivirga halotolerans]
MNFLSKQITLIFLISGLVFSCGNKDNDPSPAEQLQRKITSENWKITSFIDSGDEKTSNYRGYFFVFRDDGALSASNGINSFSGTWRIITNPSDGDDDKLEELDMEINFSNENEFDELTDVWDIFYESNTRIDLGDEGNSNESLRFENL